MVSKAYGWKDGWMESLFHDRELRAFLTLKQTSFIASTSSGEYF